MDRFSAVRPSVLHLLAISGFAVVQPLLDILARYPQFFVARHSKPVDILAFALLVSFAVPGLGWMLVVCGRLLGKGTAVAIHLACLTLLFAALSLHLAKLALGLKDPSWVGVAVVFGIVLSVVFLRIPTLRSYLALASLAPIGFVGLFILRPPISKIVFADSTMVPVTEGRNLDTPIVMVVFDELPLVSLLDAERKIDGRYYPGFAALADSSNWYRHATTVAELTEDAMVGILTGTYPDRQRLANFVDCPQNLFTLLAGSYDFSNTNELMTSLCPEALCAGHTHRRASFKDRLRELTLDSAVVYLHLILPEELAAALPTINQAWNGFVDLKDSRHNSREQTSGVSLEVPYSFPSHHWLRDLRGPVPGWYADFLDRLKPPGTGKPSLHFVHIMLPHAPWVYLPSGAQYSFQTKRIEGLQADNSWGAEPGASDRAYQSHLLQVRFTDRLVTELLHRLEAVGLYDEALVVVVADHGASFRPGNRRRHFTEENPD